jgi:DNA-binding GntR family transcriptional regulator
VVTRRLIEAHGIERPAARYGGAPEDEIHPQLLEATVVDCPAAVARLLQAPVGVACARIEYLLRMGVDINGVCTNYVIFPEGKALLSTAFRTDWYSYLDEAGLAIGDDDFLISALVADEALAERMSGAPGIPLLYLEQVIRDPAGRAFNAAYLYLRADRIMFLSHAAMPPAKAGESPE